MDLSLLIAATCLHIQGGQINPNHYNQFNPGLGVEINEKYELGAYYNSMRHLSMFATRSWSYGWFKPFLGVVSGYGLPVAPGGGLAIEPWHKEGPFLTLTPMDLKGGFVVGFAWKHQL